MSLAPELPAVRHLEQTGSTNADAAAWAREGAPHGAAVLADRQFAGRGRLGRHWLSAPGAVLLSVVLRPPLAVSRAPLLSLAAAVAVADVGGSALRIKWPNDVLAADGRKVAGVLAEMESEGGRLVHAVVGIGVNVAAVPADLPLATSLVAAGSDTPPDRVVLAVSLTRALLAACDQVVHEPGVLLDRWRKQSHTLGRVVRVGECVGQAVDIDDDGALRIATEDGTLQRVVAGDVESPSG